MNRKNFLNTTFVAGLGVALIPTILQCTTKSKLVEMQLFDALQTKSGEIQRVQGNVTAFNMKGGTIGVLETKNEFVIIDSQFPDSVQHLLDAISAKGKPISFLCNTHHHGDHTGGNIAFKGLTNNVLAQTVVPKFQKERAIEQKKEDAQLYANILFEKEYVKDFSGEKMKAMHLGAGHTFGDTIYHFENSNAAHLGDLVFNNMMPVYRTKDGSNVFGWIKYLEKIEKYFDNETKFMFGHAEANPSVIGTIQDVTKMKNFLSAAQDFAVQQHKMGLSPTQIAEKYKVVPGFENVNPRFDGHFKDFLEGIYTTNNFN